MKKILIVFLVLFCVKPASTNARTNHSFAFYEVSEPERLMNLFLKTLQSNSEKEITDFITDNYSKRFLEIPINIHLKVINDLRKDFSRHIVTQTIKKDNKISVLIKSPTNKIKKVTVETDGKLPAKIFIIDIKDAE